MRLNLEDLGLRGGHRYVATYPLEVSPLTIGGALHVVIVPEGVTVAVERIAGGYLVDLEADVTVCGPCSRCLAEVCTCVRAEQQEFVTTAAQGWRESDSESSPFVDGVVVDLVGLSREAIVLATPDRMICSEECKGLCPVCGTDLNQGECSCGTLEV